MNGKIIFSQLTPETTLLAVKLTFKKSIIAKGKFWVYFENLIWFYAQKVPLSQFSRCVLSFSFLNRPEILLCDSRKVFALELSKQQFIFNYNFIKLQIRPRGNYIGISIVLEGIKNVCLRIQHLTASPRHQEGSYIKYNRSKN